MADNHEQVKQDDEEDELSRSAEAAEGSSSNFIPLPKFLEGPFAPLHLPVPKFLQKSVEGCETLESFQRGISEWMKTNLTNCPAGGGSRASVLDPVSVGASPQGAVSGEGLCLDDYEFELLGCGPESAESGWAWKRCKKNPGHTSFIPALQFTMEHLPGGFQDKDFFEWISLTCALTVKLRVGCNSSERPKNDPFYSLQRVGTRVGTGLIGDIQVTKGKCPCSECQKNSQVNVTVSGSKECCGSRAEPLLQQDENNSRSTCGSVENSTPGECNASWSFWVRTGRHVVFDEQEAKTTWVDLFYDDEESKKDGRMASLEGVSATYATSEHDWSYFECVTHDSVLAEKMKDVLSRWCKLRKDLVRARPLELSGKIAIVSHPHGQPKQVTLGEIKLWEATTVGPWPVGYSADTCPGSSGAPVCILGRDVGESFLPHDLLLHCMGRGNGGWNTGYTVF